MHRWGAGGRFLRLFKCSSDLCFCKTAVQAFEVAAVAASLRKIVANKKHGKTSGLSVLLYYKVLIVRLKVSSTYHTSSSLRVVFSGSESWFLCIL